MPELSPTVKDDALKRLKRIEGQTRGIQRMLEEDRDCHEILNQLMAIRSAVYQATLLLVRNYAIDCLRRPDDAVSPEETINDLVNILAKMPY